MKDYSGVAADFRRARDRAAIEKLTARLRIGHTLAELEVEGFEVRDVEDWREHYAFTSGHWFRRLASAETEGERLVGRGRYRIWLAYLAGVSTAFADGSLRVYQVLASRQRVKGASELPLTRADLYRT